MAQAYRRRDRPKFRFHTGSIKRGEKVHKAILDVETFRFHTGSIKSGKRIASHLIP